jgi:hypothetical protein
LVLLLHVVVLVGGRLLVPVLVGKKLQLRVFVVVVQLHVVLLQLLVLVVVGGRLLLLLLVVKGLLHVGLLVVVMLVM